MPRMSSGQVSCLTSTTFSISPLAAASSAYRQRWRFEAEGVGLLAVDDRGNVRTPIPAGPSPRLLPFLRERILERPAPPFATPPGFGFGVLFETYK
jgi:hypothetical protein